MNTAICICGNAYLVCDSIVMCQAGAALGPTPLA